MSPVVFNFLIFPKINSNPQEEGRWRLTMELSAGPKQVS